jgi:hypothetical protein
MGECTAVTSVGVWLERRMMENKVMGLTKRDGVTKGGWVLPKWTKVVADDCGSETIIVDKKVGSGLMLTDVLKCVCVWLRGDQHLL